MNHLVCRVAINEEELRRCFEIRRKIFVEEQRTFGESDIDEYDRLAIHIIATKDEEIVGTVRVYPEGDGIWYGGRLAVLHPHRGGQLGKQLIQKAVEIVKGMKAKRFYAYIQNRNVLYFKMLGWRSVREVRKYGLPHHLMEMPL